MLDDVFERLDEWRHFPKYELERRVDIFFSFYIKKIIELKTNNKNLVDIIIPEFPVMKMLLIEDYKKLDSINIDFFISDSFQKNVFFVELKTDVKSRRSKQDKNMNKIKEINFNKIIEGIIIRSKKEPKDKEKYIFLLKKLGELGYILNYNKLISKITRGEMLLGTGEFINYEVNPNIHMIYIQPTTDSNSENVIDYEFIINNLIGKEDDSFLNLFKMYLARWQAAPGNDYENYL